MQIHKKRDGARYTCSASGRISLTAIIYERSFLYQYSVELFGNGGFEADGFFGHGMNESEHFGVETEPVNRRRLVTVPVLAVADDRTTFGGEVHTDLVRAAGLEVEFDEGILGVGR